MIQLLHLFKTVPKFPIFNAWKMYQDLKDECEAIFTAVKTLSKKQKGQGGAGDEEINENFE